MPVMTITIFPNDGGDLFDAELNDDRGTSLVLEISEVAEMCTEAEFDELESGEEIVVNYPDDWTTDDTELMEAEINTQLDLEEMNEWTQERIMEHKMLHGYHPLEDVELW